ncbi:hypothetical protein FOMPIDRAFT_1129229, partial [Fomitopsis schrenkii]
CTRCNRWYSTKQLLLLHFYESGRHPRCVECRLGFAGHEEYDQVNETLSIHYFSSKSHPKCKPCNLGFPDLAAYNAVSEEPAAHWRCESCSTTFVSEKVHVRAHYYFSPLHPRCSTCGLGFRDAAELREVRSVPGPGCCRRTLSFTAA